MHVHGQRWKFTSFSIQKVARPIGTNLQLAVNSRQVPSLSMLPVGHFNVGPTLISLL